MIAKTLCTFAALFLTVVCGKNCECTGINTGIDASIYGKDFGTSCAAWEDGKIDPQNQRSCEAYPSSEVGYWCCRPWCYVDASTCDGSQTPFYSSFVQEGDGTTLFYSFAACEDVESRVTFSSPEECPFKGPAVFEPPVRVQATIRDFDDNTSPDSRWPYGHPHFGCGICRQGPDGTHAIEPRLNAAGKPELLSRFSDHDREAFATWYTGGICSAVVSLEFKWDPARDLHVFDSSDFIPIDFKTPRGLFTTEMRTFFQYNGGEVFYFRGDDDVWVFINNTLVLDIGGCHGALEKTLSLDAVAEKVGLKVFGRYEMVLFHAERCYGESNFKAEMTIRQDQGVCVNQCNVAKERGHCNIEIGKCVCYEGWEGADCGKSVGGERVDTMAENECHYAYSYYSGAYPKPSAAMGILATILHCLVSVAVLL